MGLDSGLELFVLSWVLTTFCGHCLGQGQECGLISLCVWGSSFLCSTSSEPWKGCTQVWGSCCHVTIHLLFSPSPPSTLLFFFRYYFKKVSDEFDCGVVFEEVREDDTILPIFEEKIIGKVEKID